MSRIGYAILIALLVAGGAYVFWPQSAAGDSVPLFAGPDPLAFTVRIAGREQLVSPSAVAVAGLHRPPDAERIAGLWGFLHASRASRAHAVAVHPEDLAAYGIDGSREISAPGMTVRWAATAGAGVVWDGARGQLFDVPRATVDRLEAIAARLDDPAIVPKPEGITRILSGGTELTNVAGGWVDRGHPDRPSFNVRAQRVIDLLSTVRIERLDAADLTSAVALAECTVGGAADAIAADAAPPDSSGGGRQLTLQLVRAGADAWMCVGALPPQPLSEAAVAVWTHAITDLAADRLIDVDLSRIRNALTSVTVERGGKTWFTATRRGTIFHPDGNAWDVAWDGGRERADESAILTVASAVTRFEVDAAARRSPQTRPSMVATTVRLNLHNGSVISLTIDGDRAMTDTHEGTVRALPAELADLRPDLWLDRHIVEEAPERVTKLQRQDHEAAAATALREVLAKGDDGAWLRSWPERAPVDGVAVSRLLHGLCDAQASSVRLLSTADHEALDHPDFEIDLRIAPRADAGLTVDIGEVEDTMARDRGLAFKRSDGAWRAIDQDGGISYAVDQDLVDLLRAPLPADSIFPVVPGLVRAISISRAASRWSIERSADGWQVRLDGDAAPHPGDDTEIRRFLRTLSELQATAHEPRAQPVLPSEAVLTIACDMPASDRGTETLTVRIAAAGRDGRAAASVDTTRPSTIVPGGRATLSQSTLAALDVDASRFIAAPAR